MARFTARYDDCCHHDKYYYDCNPMTPMTLLVTGGAGFIGTNFIRMCLASGHNVVNFDKLTYASNPYSLSDCYDSDRYLQFRGDICDKMAIIGLLNEYDPTALINFAAESHVDRSIDDPTPFIQTNVVGTFSLLEAIRKWGKLDKFKFIHVSTDEVFGSLGLTGLFSESTPYDPHSPYSASKAASDHFVRAYFHTYGLPVIITNCSNNYGPYQFPEKLIPLMILNAMEGKPLPVYGDGQQVRDWIYVEDHCRAIIAALNYGVPGQSYNIGGNCERTNWQVINSICQLVDELCKPAISCTSLITHVQDRPGHDRRYAMDTTKIWNDLGWSPVESFESGLRRTVQWYLTNKKWVAAVGSPEYRKRLGL